MKTIRKARGLSQEDFSDVSSRTYMSTLERDLKSPTLNKLVELCEVMEVHPLTLLTHWPTVAMTRASMPSLLASKVRSPC